MTRIVFCGPRKDFRHLNTKCTAKFNDLYTVGHKIDGFLQVSQQPRCLLASYKISFTIDMARRTAFQNLLNDS